MDECCSAEGAYVVSHDHVGDSGGADLVYDSLVDEEGDEVGVCCWVVVVDVVCCQFWCPHFLRWCMLSSVAQHDILDDTTTRVLQSESFVLH